LEFYPNTNRKVQLIFAKRIYLLAGKRFVMRLLYIPHGSETHQPEADIIVPVVGIVVVPIRRTKVLTVVVPTAAA